MPRVSRRRRAAAIAVTIVAFALAVYLFSPIGDPDLASRPHPTHSYAEATARIAETQKADHSPIIAPRGYSIALLHGSRTATAVVIFHGYTSCPYAFRLIAQGYYDAGCNVWVPRAPYHGFVDRMTPATSRLTPQRLRAYADSAIDVGAGLGERVVVVGQSGGGTLAEWSLLTRREVVHAAAISPLLHPPDVPVWAMRPLARALALGPDIWRWWDPKLKDSPAHIRLDPNAYPRGSVRAISAYLMIGEWIAEAPWRSKAQPSGSLTLVANEHDPTIDWAYNVEVASRILPPERRTLFKISATALLGHDLVDPQGENRKRIRSSYRYLTAALGVALPDPLMAVAAR